MTEGRTREHRGRGRAVGRRVDDGDVRESLGGDLVEAATDGGLEGRLGERGRGVEDLGARDGD